MTASAPLMRVVAGNEAGNRLDACMAPLLPGMGLRGRRRLCEQGNVQVNGRTRPPGHHVAEGDIIVVTLPVVSLPQETALPACSPSPDIRGSRESDVDALADPAHACTATGRENGPEGGHGTGPLRPERLAAHLCPLFEPLREGAPAQAAGIRLIHAACGLAALYKPGGLHSAALAGGNAPSVEGLLPQLRLLNRLDGPTSGIVMVATDASGTTRWREAENAGATEKTYLAVACGNMPAPMTLRAALDTARRAVTRVLPVDSQDPLRHTEITPLARLSGLAAPAAGTTGADMPPAGDVRPGELTLVRCRIRKGARHQIRVHMAHAGYPLLGDRLYGGAPTPGLLYLHHGRIALPGFSAACPPSWLSGLSAEAVLAGLEALHLPHDSLPFPPA